MAAAPKDSDKVSQAIDAGAETAFTSAWVATSIAAANIAFAAVLGMVIGNFAKLSKSAGFAIGAAAGTVGVVIKEALHYRKDRQLKEQGIDSADRIAYKSAIESQLLPVGIDVTEQVMRGEIPLNKEVAHAMSCGCAACGKTEMNPDAKTGHADKLCASANQAHQSISVGR